MPAPEQALPATPDTGSVQASEQAPPATPNTDSVQAPDQAPPAEDAAASPPAPDLVVAPQMAALAVCATCHGADGNNWVRKDDGAFGKTDGGADSPKLTGQHSDYLFKQFGDFKSGARENAIMNGMITMLPDDQMKEAAKFYAAQKFEPAAAANAADSDAYKSGERIWRAGIASKGLPACAACHGPLGKGMPAQYPALAGQFPEYTESQLKAFRDVVRANDPSKMMRDIALKMTDPEIKAVADYAAGLR
ncbi:MAG: c-type cytochrome [Betaproteobacteria bacterium]|nr:c-type cytochrome [Betaproteobacteria bacterium]